MNTDLNNAKKNKNDEFYTQLIDIEKEMSHYKDQFKGKVIYCNCDDSRVSHFFKYFYTNFSDLGLSKLISTCYKNKYTDKALHTEFDGTSLTSKELQGDGDFRSSECVDILKQADIIVTNPPFSLFREHINQLTEHDKKFILLGNQNAIACKDVFKLIKDKKLWLGASIHGGDREFQVPYDYPLYAWGSRTDEQGTKFVRVKGVRWFTNLDYGSRYADLELTETYTPDKYVTYENYNAINVDVTKLIPCDYDGIMGVPITFIDKWNPEQFEILGLSNECEFTSHRKMEKLKQGEPTGKYTINAGSHLYRLYDPMVDKKPPAYKDCENGNLYVVPYKRILIRKIS